MTQRLSGILMHPTALPGQHGIGDIGAEAYNFIDNLSEMGQSLWQILPLGPTDIYNSPYSSISTFAGNHLLISLDLLVEDDLLSANSLEDYNSNDEETINFNEVIKYKLSILEEVSKNFGSKASKKIQNSFNKFCIENSFWLDDYSQYWALKKENDLTSWIQWRQKSVSCPHYIYEAKIMQFLFHYQWERLQKYCHSKGVQIIGDMPIYVGYDSADVFYNKELFQLDGAGEMLWQSGCPPCEFQEDGQLWGAPLYNWKNHEEQNFDWWKKRFKKLFGMVDIIRLDHFIGYAHYYRIPMNEETAKNGQWINAPGEKLFKELIVENQNFRVIAEDLGSVTKEVINLRNRFKFPGMRVLQFELNPVPHKGSFDQNSIVCTGTHDNDTIMGWYSMLPYESKNRTILTKKKLLEIFNCKENNIHWEIIKFAFSTGSNMIVIPIQDLLGEGTCARFNEPGVISSKNWSWRMKDEKLTNEIKNNLFQITKNYMYLNN
mgnify:FL=1